MGWREDREDPDHLDWVRGLPCLVCRAHGVDAHHLLNTGDRGINMRSPDEHAVPLCRSCHVQLHHHGREQEWFALQGVEAYEWVKLNGRKRGDAREESPGLVAF